MGSLTNLTITATNAAYMNVVGGLGAFAQSKLANWGRGQSCKFYYDERAGGSILKVVGRALTQGAVNELKDLAQNEFNKLLNKKKVSGEDWVENEVKAQQEEAQEFGKMQVDGGVVYALDDWGCIAPEALMLGIKLKQGITVSQPFPSYKGLAFGETDESIGSERENVIPDCHTLVWYDTTALISINSDKNVVITKVQGRDYSRKELVSNGDIKFSVTGQITSGKPDVYPTKEIQKFLKVMQYKGIVKVNNQLLSQFGITEILITDFNLTPKEGYKSLQQYSFSAIGLQPENIQEITEDTVEIIAQKPVGTTEDSDSEWMKMLKGQLGGLKSMASDVVSQGLGIATGLLDNVL